MPKSYKQVSVTREGDANYKLVNMTRAQLLQDEWLSQLYRNYSEVYLQSAEAEQVL
jgi:hypothetical protein